jgi:hypothetical protein
MPRLLVHVEGKTEEMFVKHLLSEHLIRSGFERIDARVVGNTRLRERRGGIRPWETVRRDILRHLVEDAGAVATTLVDYYALPQSWPGRADASGKHGALKKAEYLEAALLGDLIRAAGARFNPRRFIPFVVMHEFEGLLFSHPENFARAINRPDLASSFALIRGRFATPEDINDSAHTAPSKQILSLNPKYQKPLQGVQAAIEIGLEAIRNECPHFNDWLVRLEALPSTALISQE